MNVRTVNQEPTPVATATPTSAVSAQPPPAVSAQPQATSLVRVFGHSALFYWWPVWAVGFVMAALTYWSGIPSELGNTTVRLHPSSNLGVFYFLTLFLVVLITNHSVRGAASVAVVMVLLLGAVTLAYLGWWDVILGWFGDLKIHLNFGAYFWPSTLLFIAWLVTFFVVDRLNYYEVTPGQVTHVTTFGLGSKSYDTKGMVVQKRRRDLFRHVLLGLGAGDVRITTSGAERETIDIPNVLFVDTKLVAVEGLISADPSIPVRV